MRRRALGLAVLLASSALGLVTPSLADTLDVRVPSDSLGASPTEPPPEAIEGDDYEIEPADSLAEGSVELGVGAAGRAGGRVQRRRRVRFAGDGVRGTVREGSGDPLAGGSLDARLGGGAVVVGRLAPAWGRGLLLGGSGEPWQRAALDRGAGSPFRGRSGEGLLYRRGEGRFIETLGGRFARRDLAGARVGAGRLGVGVLTSRSGRPQASLALGSPATLPGGGIAVDGIELALDGAGRWRAAGLTERPFGRWRAIAQARGGHPGYRSAAEPARSGPARSLAMSLEGPAAGFAARALVATWSFRPTVSGARLALEVDRVMAHHAALALGIEEQRGTRRDPPARSPATRQGAWAMWRSPAAPLVLGLRHEAWGARALARGAVRVVTSASVEAQMPAQAALRVSHTSFRVRRGESLYLAEVESDRVVLRALAGEGRRTRVEADLPVAGGRLRGALHLLDAAGRSPRPQWTVDWSRRARARGAREPP